jgi:hypothetical protein
MLIAALAIWLALVLLAVAFCRAAAGADRHHVIGGGYPTRAGRVAEGGGVAQRSRVAGEGLGAREKAQGALGEGRTHGREPVLNCATACCTIALGAEHRGIEDPPS